MCASRFWRRGRARSRHGRILKLRLSAFRFRIFFFRSCPFVIHAEAALANASTGICCCSFAWTTGSSAVVASQRMA